MSPVLPPYPLSTSLGLNIGGAAPVDKWAQGEMVGAEICDVSILWRGESDSEKTYKRRCCQIMQQPWGSMH